MAEDPEIELRSEEVQEILSSVPSWIIRWGNVVILTIMILVFSFSWLIRYPDVITTEIKITTLKPPEKLVAKSTGKIQKIFIEDRAIVPSNTPIAVIENPANYRDVFFLKKIIDTIKVGSKDFSFPLDKIPVLNLGNIENAYAIFEKDYLAYKFNRDLHPYVIDINAQSIETIEQNKRLNLLLTQEKIAQREMQFKTQEFERHKKLYEKGVISTQEWEQRNISYLQQERNLNSLTSQISQLKSALNDLHRDKKATVLNQTKDDVSLLQNAIISFNNLKKTIAEWDMTYVLRSSNAGKVSFMQIWVENQTITSGDDVFVIIPDADAKYVGKIKAPILNSGKIKAGQDINIRLANYPDREFGVIEGRVKSISLTPDKDNNLLIDVVLPNGLQTSYRKEIKFQQEMMGNADIITEDLRLIERFLYQFRDVFSKN